MEAFWNRDLERRKATGKGSSWDFLGAQGTEVAAGENSNQARAWLAQEISASFLCRTRLQEKQDVSGTAKRLLQYTV